MAALKQVPADTPARDAAHGLLVVPAFLSLKALVTPTGGQRYNLRLMDAWSQTAQIRYADVRHRWFRLRCWSPALLCFHARLLSQADIVFQDASSPIVSAWLVRACRLLFPRAKHIGIVYHPRWLEQPDLLARERDIFNSFDHLITISRHTSATLRSEGVRPPIHLLPPGRSKMPARTAPPADPPLILWNGYLLARKGPLLLLEALARLRHDRWQAQFLISMRPAVEFDQQFQERLEAMPPALRDRIQLSSHLPLEEFRARFLRAAIFCLPSIVEGYSISTAEAMACGCAVVVPRTDNFLELLGTADYAGFYDPADPEDLARQLDRLLGDDSLRAAAAAFCLERSAQLPDWEQFAVQAGVLLREMVAPGVQATRE